MYFAVSLGPFALDGRIGEGAMGVIYRAIHRETALPVCVKVIRRAAGRSVRRRFHEEVQAHAGLLHPGIVYLFEYGEIGAAAAEAMDGALHEGSPYVAMELADRGTLRDILPLSNWGDVRRILVQILDALAHAHARGVVHRDLKPQNMLVFEAGDDRRVKLADFGIAHAFDRELEAETEELASAVGTPVYMAPEQLRGEWRDYGPWTDLYAVGCVAWEFVCGRPPFEADNFFAFARKHETADRPRLDPRFPVPEQLESWIHRAMAPEPTRRFRRAADALWALPRIASADTAVESTETSDASGQSSKTERWTRTLSDAPARATTVDLEAYDGRTTDRTSPDASATDADDTLRATDVIRTVQPPVPEQWRPRRTQSLPAPLVGAGLGLFGLREAPFVDRDREGDEIWAALRRVVDDQTAQFVFISGEAGTGKSRLAEWVATRAHEVGAARILRAAHAESEAPAAGLRRGIERVLRTLKLGRGELFDYLSERLPARNTEPEPLREHDVRALTEFLRPTGGDVDAVDGPRYRFSHPRQRRALLVRLFARLAQSRPLIFWVDDLQWGPLTQRVLEHLVDGRGPSPEVLVLATLRSHLLAERGELEERVEALAESVRARWLSLAPLSKPDQRELLDGLLPLDDALAERLADRTEGHPLFAMQLLGHWIDRGVLVLGDDGFRLAEEDGVALPDDIFALWTERIDRLADSTPDERDATIEAVELAAALGREVDLDVWRAVLGDTPEVDPDRLVSRLTNRGLAERSAEGWAFAHGLLVESVLRRARDAGRMQGHHRRIARTFEEHLPADEPGLPLRVAEHWVAAGEQERALERLGDAAELSRRRAEPDQYRRILARRRELLDELELPESDAHRLRQQLLEVRRIARIGEIEEAHGRLSELWSALGPEQRTLRGETALMLGQLERDFGNHGRARDLMRRGREIGRELHNLYLQSRSEVGLAWLHMACGDLADAAASASRAAELGERAGHLYQQIDARRVAAHVRFSRGDEGVREDLEQVREEAAEAGYVFIEAQALNGLGEWARFEENLDAARGYYRRYRRKMVELSQPRAVAVGALNRAQVEVRAGRLDAAEEFLETARRGLDEIGAAESRQGVLHAVRLATVAGRRDREAFDGLWEPIAEGWPDEWRLIKDHPWLLEIAAEYAERAGWHRVAREVWQLAEDLWRRLGDETSADRIASRLEEARDS